MILTIDTEQPLNDSDRQVLMALMQPPPVMFTPPEPPRIVPHGIEKAARDMREALEKMYTPKWHTPATEDTEEPPAAPSASQLAEIAEEAPETAEEATVDGALLEEAIKRTTALLQAGKDTLVLETLAKAGVERVTHLKSDSLLRAYLAELP